GGVFVVLSGVEKVAHARQLRKHAADRGTPVLLALLRRQLRLLLLIALPRLIGQGAHKGEPADPRKPAKTASPRKIATEPTGHKSRRHATVQELIQYLLRVHRCSSSSPPTTGRVRL